ncbi:hypothetical protein GCM10009657_17240 [Oryzihumus leptocrescens]
MAAGTLAGVEALASAAPPATRPAAARMPEAAVMSLVLRTVVLLSGRECPASGEARADDHPDAGCGRPVQSLGRRYELRAAPEGSRLGAKSRGNASTHR